MPTTEIWKKLIEFVVQAGAKATLLLAVLALALAFLAQYAQLSVFKDLKLTPAEFFASSAVLFLLATLLWWIQRNQLSRVSKPEAFRNINETFVGREEEIAEYSALIPRIVQMWITGESGSGKSTLIRRGILPKLEKDPTLCPLYIERWGTDWVQGPVEELTRGLQQNLTAEDRTKIDWKRVLSPEALATVLRNVQDQLLRTPVLLFDQFDDYLTIHRENFIAAAGQVLTKDELLEQNAFWREIAQLCAQSAVRTVFVTRSDIQWARLSVRFATDEQERVLPRLKRDMLDQLLMSLDGAVENPQNGWKELRDELSRSLTAEGGVLPIQVRFVVQSLPALAHLTSADYRRVGGVTGLIAQYFQDRIDQESHAAGLKSEQVRAMLRSLIDIEGGSNAKTVPRPETSFTGFVPPENAGRLRMALERLQAADLVRSFVSGPGSEATWKLDHDYLCRPLLYMEERLNPARTELERNEAAFKSARTVQARFRALLSPLAWLRVLYARLRKRLYLGAARRYFAYSSVRLIVTPYVFIPLLLGYAAFRINAEFEARDLVSGLDSGLPLAEQHLWALSHANYEVRKEALRRVLRDEVTQKTFLTNSTAQLLTAIAGLRVADRNSISQDVIRPLCYETQNHNIPYLRTCAIMASALDPQTQRAAAYLIEAMSQIAAGGQANAFFFTDIAMRLGELPTLETEQAHKATEILFRNTDPTKVSSSMLSSLVRSFVAINGAETVKADNVAQILLACLNREDLRTKSKLDYSRLAYFEELYRSLEAITNRVSLHEAEVMARSLRDNIPALDKQVNRLGDYYYAGYPKMPYCDYAVALSAVSSRLDSQETTDAVSFISSLLSGKYLYATELIELSRAMKLLSRHLTVDQAHLLQTRLSELELQVNRSRGAADARWLAALQVNQNSIGVSDKVRVASTLSQLSNDLERDDFHLTEGRAIRSELSALRSYIDAVTAHRAAEKILGRIEHYYEHYYWKGGYYPELHTLSELVSLYGSAMPSDAAISFLRTHLSSIRNLVYGDSCVVIAGFLRRENLAIGVEVLKWPVCSERARTALLARLAELTGEAFVTPSGNDDFQPHWWAFLEWVHKKENMEKFHLQPDRAANQSALSP